MLTVQSKTNKDRMYFFESLNLYNSKHPSLATSENLKKGLYVKIPGKLESTITMNTPSPNKESLEPVIEIIKDCAHPELVASYDLNGFEGMYTFLKACGVHELPYRIHTLTKILI